MDLRRSDPTDAGLGRTATLVIAGVFAAVALLAALDLAGDLRDGTTAGHVAVEGAIAFAGACGLVVLMLRHVRLRRSEAAARVAADGLSADLASSRAEAERWRGEAHDLLAGLGAMIDRQFGRWQFSPAEKEVALLMLKGLSHKEVAAARGVSEATVRQQATGCYRKAGVAGRHDLVAFFLEDLLAPGPRTGTPDRS